MTSTVSTARKQRRPRSGRRARGFTLVSTVVGTTLAGIVLGGAWMTFASMQVQWKIANADRQMDQYAAAVMQELTNTLCWGWGAKEVQGGPRNTRWEFVIDDLIEENGQINRYRYDPGPDNFITLTYRPTQGILFNGVQPRWVRDRNRSYYLWSGSTPPTGRVRVFDRRDRMTVEELMIDFNLFRQFQTSVPLDLVKRRGVVTIRLTMHYTYRASDWARRGPRAYGDTYVREREYSTQVSLRNWDVEANEFRSQLLYSYGGQG